MARSRRGRGREPASLGFSTRSFIRGRGFSTPRQGGRTGPTVSRWGGRSPSPRAHKRGRRSR